VPTKDARIVVGASVVVVCEIDATKKNLGKNAFVFADAVARTHSRTRRDVPPRRARKPLQAMKKSFRDGVRERHLRSAKVRTARISVVVGADAEAGNDTGRTSAAGGGDSGADAGQCSSSSSSVA
jgi:hypothetical protein